MSSSVVLYYYCIDPVLCSHIYGAVNSSQIRPVHTRHVCLWTMVDPREVGIERQCESPPDPTETKPGGDSSKSQGLPPAAPVTKAQLMSVWSQRDKVHDVCKLLSTFIKELSNVPPSRGSTLYGYHLIMLRFPIHRDGIYRSPYGCYQALASFSVSEK